ncbi:hypothetical protein PRK78_003009 [Emydomyces testavorans]|uniref:EGF-like domain-containing protein n=1 Tax=Emydomyces testavorans TaxID=2070801 RepID=A0AAF0DFF6_9EURO|nr:hypothetical protein PRK78_003009 [Emydomyces testavorans]
MSGGRYEDANYGGKGSVRRAREMMQAGLLADRNVDVGRGQGNQSPNRLPARRPPPVPAAFPTVAQGPRGPNMLPPTMPPWPLPDNTAGLREMNKMPDNMAPLDRSTPQGSPRAGTRNGPPPLDASRMQYRQPASILEYQYEDPARRYLQDLTPFLDQGRSPDTLTDPFSSPELSPDRNYLQRNQYFGPPSARRGASSLYPNSPNISPIQEEFLENSPRKPASYASSKVIPSSWGTAPIEGEFRNSSRESLSTSGGDDDVGLVRQASVGKRGKPSLRTINKPQNGQNPENETRRGDDPNFNAREMAPTTTDAGTALGNQQNPSNQLRTRCYSSDSTSSNGSAFDDLEKPPIPTTQFSSSLSDVELKELEAKDGSRAIPRSSLSRLDTKRPPPLDIDAVREAEARGSLTSLPDLIRRATRLASNLDRGKTASRLGVLDKSNGSSDSNNRRSRNSGSISDILASFPPPGHIGTPTAGSRGSAMYNNRVNPSANPPEITVEDTKLPPRCCGMSRCAFIFIIFILFLLISSAVIIPVVLIALPQERDKKDPNKPTSSASVCQKSSPCLNGGVSIGREGSCGCVCVNGFRGPKCAVAGDDSCATVNLNKDYRNATVGNALPRLFEQSEANFSIPLNASKILGLFNKEDLSCTSENALVTFNGANRRRHLVIPGSQNSDLGPDDALISQRYHNRNHVPIARRDDINLLISLNTGPTSTILSISEPSKTIAPPERTSQPAVPPRTSDFARLAVLFILEHTEEIPSATTAHDTIQGFLKLEGSDLKAASNTPMNLKYGEKSFALNFNNHTIQLGNSTGSGRKSGA